MFRKHTHTKSDVVLDQRQKDEHLHKKCKTGMAKILTFASRSWVLFVTTKVAKAGMPRTANCKELKTEQVTGVDYNTSERAYDLKRGKKNEQSFF